MKKILLGVKIDDINMDQAVEIIKKWNRKPGKHYIVTPNPEFLADAQKDLIFKNVLNKADLAIPDGVGLKLSGKIKNTVYGTDLMEKLIHIAVEKGFTVAFLGGKQGVAEKLKECLLKKYPKLKVSFAGSGGQVDNQGKLLKFPKQLRSLNCDFLFVAFGHIKQEKWIANNLADLLVKVVMGVGGAFDYLSGSVPRAPRFVRTLGFEWLFRLIIEPWRIKRQIALLKYLWLLTRNR